MFERGETFEIDDPQFQCLVCEEEIEFDFNPKESLEPEGSPELPDEFKEEFEEKISTPENFVDEVEDFEEVDESMKVECPCGAEYIVKKVSGVPGFKVTHLAESGSELVENEFEEV